MGKYVTKPTEIEAITFGELISYCNRNGANIVNDMPWSFEFNGYQISHATDSLYLIGNDMKMGLHDMLVIDGPALVVVSKEIFDISYDEVE